MLQHCDQNLKIQKYKDKKTDMDMSELQQAIQPAFQSKIQKSKNNSKSFQQPTPRIFHSCVCHRGYVFIYGGLSLNNSQEFQNEHIFIYRYEIHRFQWKKIQTNFPTSIGPSNPLQNIYSHSCVVHGNVMYLFGGKNGKNGSCQNQLWAMNIQSFNWRKQDQKGVIPAKRQSASLVLVNKTNLFLYGGKNQDHIFNDIHIYKIQSKQWYSVETNNSQFLMSKRLRPGICVVNDVIYIFGGERDSSVEDKQQILDDFYQIKIIQKSTSVKPDIWAKKISTLLNPGRIVGCKLFSVSQRYVGLLGTSNSSQQQSKNKLWLYDPLKIKWIYSKLEDQDHCGIGLGFGALFQYDRVYISGGLNQDFTPNTHFCSIYIDINQISTRGNQSRQIQNNQLCMVCEEQKYSLCRKKMNGYGLFQQYLKQIKYPFNSFGLLVDNSNLLKSTVINITCAHVGKQKYLIFQDDGNCDNVWLNQEEFLEDMIRFRTISEQQMEFQGDQNFENQQENIDQNMDLEESPRERKKPTNLPKDQILMGAMKKEQDKEEQRKLKKKKQLAKKTKARQLRRRKQFSINIKVGAMRLAKKMLYISHTSDGSKRIFLLEQIKIVSIDQQQSEHKQNQVKYQCHYYNIPSQSSSSVSSYSNCEQSKNYIQTEYKNFLKVINENGSLKNHLILIGLREYLTQDNVKQPQLKINTKMNDIYYGSNKLLIKAENLNILLPDCIDVSLKCYLSLLYLKGEYAKITLSTQAQKVEEVTNSLYFQKIDTLVKSNNIMDLQAAFDLQQCKIVQIYYHKNLTQISKKSSKKQKNSLNKDNSTNLNIFFNGILIYHRNRLIKRYEYPFGTLLRYNDLRRLVTKNFNPLKIFGFIELDEVFYNNIIKTSLVNEQNLSNMYTRIKFVEKYLQTKSQQSNQQMVTKRNYKKFDGQIDQKSGDNKKKVKTD